MKLFPLATLVIGVFAFTSFATAADAQGTASWQAHRPGWQVLLMHTPQSHSLSTAHPLVTQTPRAASQREFGAQAASAVQ
jgi:hypothetical protein